MDQSPHKSDFVFVNGINLHYLDWGGEGDPLIFLTGMGCSAHLFDHLAPRFTDIFRVLALTRRGQAQSDYPATGYDLDTLIDDVYDFMETLRIDKAILAGHSLAGIELAGFAEKYPHKVIKLVFLDAVYDAKGRMSLFEKDPLKDVSPPNPKKEFSSIAEYAEYVKYLRPDLAKIWNESWDTSMEFELQEGPDGLYKEKETGSIAKQMINAMEGFDPANAGIRVPVLSFVAHSHLPAPRYFSDEQKRILYEFECETWLPFQQTEIAKLKEDIPHAKVVELQDSHHYCFMWQEDIVYAEMRMFLLE